MISVKVKRLAMLLALTMLAALFAGCGSEPAKPADATAVPARTNPATQPQTEPVTEPETEPPHDHVAAEEYTVDLEPTCLAAGSKSLHCTICDEKIPGTEIEIPSDPDDHTVNPYDWTDNPTAAFWRTGSRSGVCLVCGKTVTEELELTTPDVYASDLEAADRTGMTNVKGNQYMYAVKIAETIYDPFYPTDEEPEGLDLLVEFSFLWNDTLRGLGGDLAVMHIEDYNLFNINLGTGLISSRERDGDVYVYPSADEIRANPELGQVSIGEYGWHRIGVRIHQESVLENGEFNNLYLATLYLDGEQVLSVDKTKWVFEGSYGKDRTVSDARLFKGEVINGTLIYSDNTLYNAIRICHEDFFKAGPAAYLVIADISVTAGHDFVEKVKPAVLPIQSGDFKVSDTVYLPAARYFEEK